MSHHQQVLTHMPRKIFTIVAAHPVEVGWHELPRVRVDSFLVEGESLQAAFARVAPFEGVVGATEVFSIECSDVMLSPSTSMRREEGLREWLHWSGLVRRGELDAGWSLLAEGPESFSAREERVFAERCPHLA